MTPCQQQSIGVVLSTAHQVLKCGKNVAVEIEQISSFQVGWNTLHSVREHFFWSSISQDTLECSVRIPVGVLLRDEKQKLVLCCIVVVLHQLCFIFPAPFPG